MRLFKSFSTLTFLLFFSLGIQAQKATVQPISDEITDRYGSDQFDVYVAPYINFGSVTEAFKSSYGLEFGIQKRHMFFGVFGELGDMGNVQFKSGEMRETDYGMLGLQIGAITNPTKKLRVFGSVKGGYGFGDYRLMSGETGEDIVDDPDGVHLLRPEAGIEFGLNNKLRLVGVLGYDFTASVHEFPQIEDADLRKLNFGLKVRVML